MLEIRDRAAVVAPSEPRAARLFPLLVAPIAAAGLIHALYLAYIVVPSHDESSALFFGQLAASGQISMFEDGVVGQRAPGVPYIFGLTQLLAGRDLLAARYLGVALCGLLVVLTAVLARRLAGPLAGLLAGVLLAGQGSLVAYYAFGDFHALVPVMVLVGLLLMFARRTPARNVLAMAVFASLFFIRSHVMPMIPLALGYALWRARGPVERAALLAVTAGPPLAFLLWDPKHLKLLAHMPVVNALARPLGYLPFLYLDARPFHGLESQLWRLATLVRRYEFLALLSVVALMAVAWRVRRTGRAAPYLSNRGVNVVAGLFLAMLAVLLVVFRMNYKWVGMYFASLGPLLAIVLGAVWATLLTDEGIGRWLRRAGMALFALGVVLPVYYNRNPSMPIGELRRADPVRAVYVAAAHLARVVPANTRVFFFGPVDVYYLAGLPPTYLPQITNYDTIAVHDEDNWATTRSGYYGMLQVEYWLGVDAEYAVVSPEALTTFAVGFHGHPDVNVPKVERIKTLLARHFEKIDTVREYPLYTYDVYRRVRPGPAVLSPG
ncbi:MAG: hypothetical protein HYU41_15725 [Candidatus Rokubacteria bacterium]|nr:hypothetical protein [Candidatus Rokubacteria bacterium]